MPGCSVGWLAGSAGWLARLARLAWLARLARPAGLASWLSRLGWLAALGGLLLAGWLQDAWKDLEGSLTRSTLQEVGGLR